MYRDILKSLKDNFPEFNDKIIDSIPNCKTLNNGFNFINENRKKLIFCQQDESMPGSEMGYEERIFKKGIIATRNNNWHDFFNAMVWHSFPKIKISINAIHQKEIDKQTDNKRSRIRDLLTLFDECGVIVISNKQYLEMIRKHNWEELFIRNKQSWLNGEIKIVTFGHAMFEKYLNPYIGMTAHALLLENMDNNMDEYISKRILRQQLLQSKSELSPLPVLGVPGWHSKQTDEFYANKNYFR